MKVTKRQLRRIIKEEKQKILKEYGYLDKEVANPTVEFAMAWASLGAAVQEQMIEVINAFGSGDFEDAVYGINPNAFDIAEERLGRSLRQMSGEDAEDLKDVMEQARSMMRDM